MPGWKRKTQALGAAVAAGALVVLACATVISPVAAAAKSTTFTCSTKPIKELNWLYWQETDSSMDANVGYWRAESAKNVVVPCAVQKAVTSHWAKWADQKRAYEIAYKDSRFNPSNTYTPGSGAFGGTEYGLFDLMNFEIKHYHVTKWDDVNVNTSVARKIFTKNGNHSLYRSQIDNCSYIAGFAAMGRFHLPKDAPGAGRRQGDVYPGTVADIQNESPANDQCVVPTAPS